MESISNKNDLQDKAWNYKRNLLFMSVIANFFICGKLQLIEEENVIIFGLPFKVNDLTRLEELVYYVFCAVFIYFLIRFFQYETPYSMYHKISSVVCNSMVRYLDQNDRFTPRRNNDDWRRNNDDWTNNNINIQSENNINHTEWVANLNNLNDAYDKEYILLGEKEDKATFFLGSNQNNKSIIDNHKLDLSCLGDEHYLVRHRHKIAKICGIDTFAELNDIINNTNKENLCVKKEYKTARVHKNLIAIKIDKQINYYESKELRLRDHIMRFYIKELLISRESWSMLIPSGIFILSLLNIFLVYINAQ